MSDHHATTAAPATIELTIDGKNFTVPRGTTILEAARKNGIYIPTLCYLKKLNPIGSCRICSVEVEGSKGPIMSCVTPVVQGMKVTTQSPALEAHRQNMMRFILTNHPLDCPVCERSGECSLQNRTFELNVTSHATKTDGYKKTPVQKWELIRYDRNLCIFCERCVKVCREVQGIAALSIDGTGYKARIAPNAGDTLDCDFCGQCMSVCPVGALSSAIIFNGRAWEMEKTATVCQYCAVGCTLEMNTRRGAIVRVTSNDDIGVNNGNLCARGRFGFQGTQTDDRIKTPLIRKGNRLEPATWEAAAGEVVSKLSQIQSASGPGSIAVIGGETLSNEDAYVLQKVFRAGLGVSKIDNPANMRNPGLNSGLFDTFGAAAPIVTYDEITKAGSFLFFGCDAEKENPVIANMVRTHVRDTGAPMFAMNARNINFFPPFKNAAAYTYGGETALIAGLIRIASEKAKADAALTKSANAISLEAAAKASGVSADKMKEILAEIQKNGAPLIVMGIDVYTHPHGVEIAKGLSNLAAMLGGKTLLYRGYCNSQGVNDMGLSPTHLPGYMKSSDASAAAHYSAKWGKKIAPAQNNGVGIIEGLAQKKIRAVVIARADIVSNMPDGAAVKKALESAEFVVVTGQFLNETALRAHVVLPSISHAERGGSFTNNEGRKQSQRGVVAPIGESKAEWEIFTTIGKGLGLDLGYENDAQITAEIAADVPGYGSAVAAYPKGDGAKGFEFDTSALASPASGEFGTLAVTGNTLFHLGTMSRRSPALNGLEPRAYVQMNPADADKAGLKDGDDAQVESKTGSLRMKVEVTAKSPSGVVFLAKNFENAPALSLVSGNGSVAGVKISKPA